MKKLSLLFVGFCSCLLAMSQNETTTPMAKKTYFGIKAGANLATFRVESDATQVNMKTSAAFGLLANIPLGTGKLFFQPELIYTGVGAKIKSPGSTTSISTEQDLGYVALPLMLQLKSSKGVFVELGAQPAYLVRAQLDVNGNETDNKSAKDKFDLGLNGGLGYMSRIGLGINARYTLGLTNTVDDGGGNNSPNNGTEFKNSVIHIGLVYLFGAGK